MTNNLKDIDQLLDRLREILMLGGDKYEGADILDELSTLINQKEKEARIDEIEWIMAHGSWLEKNTFNAVRNHLDDRLEQLKEELKEKQL